MAWDGTPWFVGGGAQHSPETARLLGFVAFRGSEGILGSGDLKVSPLVVPGGQVRVGPGACSILSRASGGTYQAYAGRNPGDDIVNVAPTDSTAGGRHDLVVARVEDPFLAGEPWPTPANPASAQYIYSRIIPGVPASTTTVAQLGLGYSAIALARLDIPANTGTITSGMIVDLRKIANPRRERQLLTYQVPDSTTWGGAVAPTFTDWIGSWPVAVPSWAVQAVVRFTLGGVRAERSSATVNGALFGQVRARIGSTFTQGTAYDYDIPTSFNYSRETISGGDTVAIPSNVRGTTQTVALQAYQSPGANMYLKGDGGTSVTADVEFLEVPA